jgi:hypothetical protein
MAIGGQTRLIYTLYNTQAIAIGCAPDLTMHFYSL